MEMVADHKTDRVKRTKRLYRIGSAAVEAMLYEVASGPKPGLVDRYGSGSHKDMNLFTFLSGAAGMHGCFDEMAQIGYNWRFAPIKNMWPELRTAGLAAEERMFSCTGGVNTQKGEIFSLGILSACAARLVDCGPLSAETVCNVAAELCQGICDEARAEIKEHGPTTGGERAIQEYGILGARGEAESGYRTVREISLPVYRQLLAQKTMQNDALVQTLLYLIAGTDDSNVASKLGPDLAWYARQKAAEAIRLGGVLTDSGKRYVEQMDEEFTEKRISPGGCADLLAVTHFLFRIEGE